MSPVGNRAMSYPQGSPLPPNAVHIINKRLRTFACSGYFLLGTVLHKEGKKKNVNRKLILKRSPFDMRELLSSRNFHELLLCHFLAVFSVRASLQKGVFQPHLRYGYLVTT